MHRVVVKLLSPRPNRNPQFFDDAGGQRNILSNDNVVGGHLLNDHIVSDISPVADDNQMDIRRLGNSDRLIGNKRQFKIQSCCRSNQNALDRARACVGIYPNLDFFVRGNSMLSMIEVKTELDSFQHGDQHE